MNLQIILDDIKTLPLEKQEEVVDFVAFLKLRFGTRKEQASSANAAVKSDSVFGTWSDRVEMADSSSWVRDLRSREWKIRNG